MPDYLILIALFIAGALASFINVMAGGGSVLTMGLMLLLGIDSSIANGTNRIGILVGCASGTAAFKTEKHTDFKQSIMLGLWALPGALFGALYSIQLSNLWFQRIFGIITILILFTLLKKPTTSTKATPKTSRLIYPVMFVIGLYGGFIQVGVGYLLMGAFTHLLKLDLVKVNIHKLFVTLFYTVPVLFIFGSTGNINWMYAAALGSGNAIGGWLSAKLSIKKGEKIIKAMLVISFGITAIKLIFSF